MQIKAAAKHTNLCKNVGEEGTSATGKVPLQLIHMTTNDCQMIATLFLGLASAAANVSAQLCVRDKKDLARAVVLSRQSRQSQRTKVRKQGMFPNEHVLYITVN